jgi:hypothetical protein
MHRFQTFKAWFQKTYMSSPTHDTMIALHIEAVKPKYRDQYPGDKNPVVPGMRAMYLASILEAPEIALPSEFRDAQVICTICLLSPSAQLLNSHTAPA